MRWLTGTSDRRRRLEALVEANRALRKPQDRPSTRTVDLALSLVFVVLMTLAFVIVSTVVK